MLKDVVRSLVNPLGFDIVKYPLSPLGRGLRDYLRTKQINLIIDAGAFDGMFCRMIRSEGEYSGRIVSFEPCRATFRALQNTMSKDTSWYGYQLGLSASSGKATLNTYPDNPDWNSLHELRGSAANAYGIDSTAQTAETITLRTIDEMWGEITDGLERPRVFLKMDTQGHDLSVIEGATEHLGFIIGLLSEVPAIEMYDGMTSMSDTLRLFKEIGYSPIGFFPVSSPTVFDGAVPEFDVVLTKINSGSSQ